jgi:hypothetical protein
MKRIPLLLMAASLSFASLAPNYAQAKTTTRPLTKMEKKQIKAQKKYAKAQRKAQSKMVKYDRKHTTWPPKH